MQGLLLPCCLLVFFLRVSCFARDYVVYKLVYHTA